MKRVSIALVVVIGLFAAGCSSSGDATKGTAEEEAALKSGTGVKPPAGFKAPGGPPAGTTTTGG